MKDREAARQLLVEINYLPERAGEFSRRVEERRLVVEHVAKAFASVRAETIERCAKVAGDLETEYLERSNACARSKPVVSHDYLNKASSAHKILARIRALLDTADGGDGGEKDE